MKRCYFLLFFLATLSSSLLAQSEKTVSTSTEGVLGTFFTTSDYDNVTKLTISGKLNAYDFVFIRRFTKLVELDLTNVEIVEFPNELNNRDYYFFYAANQLPHGGLKNMKIKKIAFPTSINSIGKMALSNTHIKGNLIIPEGIVTIEESAFSICDSITSVAFPTTLTTIGNSAFGDCKNISGVLTFPSSLVKIGASAFRGCTGITGLANFPASLQYIGMFAFKECTALSGSITLPSTLKKTGNAVFSSTKISSVQIDMDTIPDGVFDYCLFLTDVTMNNTKVIGAEAFLNCSTLTHIDFPVSVKEIGNTAFANTNLSGSIVLPDGVERIGENTFSGLKFTGINLPNSLKYIGYRAFFECTELNQDIFIPDRVAAVGDNAFYNCTKIKRIKLPDNNASIGHSAFENCSGVTAIIIPAHINAISDQAFNNCTGVDSIFSYNPTPPSILQNTFSTSMHTKSKVYVVPASIDAYKANQYWGLFGNNIVSNIFPDVKAPELLSMYPANQLTDVSTNPSFMLKFNEKVLLTDNFQVKFVEKNNSSKVHYLFGSGNRVKTDSTVVYMEPSKTYLSNNTDYKIIISQGSFSDIAGNTFPIQDMEVEFKTGMTFQKDYSFNMSGIVPVKDYLFLHTISDSWQCSNGSKWHEIVFKHDLKHNELAYTVFDTQSECMRENVRIPVPNYTFMDTTAVVLSDALGFYPKYNKVKFVLPEYPENAPMTSVVLKLSFTSNTGGIPMKVLAYFKNGETKSMSILNASDAGFANYEVDANGNYIYCRDIEIPILPNEIMDSVVVDKGDIVLLFVRNLVIKYNVKSKPVVNLGPDRNMCSFSDNELDAGYFPNASYVWNTGEKTQTIKVTATGDYSVSVKNQLGTASDTVHINAYPRPLKTYGDSILYKCDSESITLSATYNPTFTYKWNTGAATRSITVTDEGLYTVEISNGVCSIIDSVTVQNVSRNMVFKLKTCCQTGYDDIRGELYKKAANGHFDLFESKIMYGDMALFASVPVGQYIFKAHFLKYSNGVTNPWLDTYHNGSSTWLGASVINVSCKTDTTITFDLSAAPTGFTFNGTGSISGQIYSTGGSNAPENLHRSKAIVDNCDTKVLLYDGNNALISFVCVDEDGKYSFTGLPAGNYSISIEKTGYTVKQVFSVTLTDGGTIQAADFTVNENDYTIEKGKVTGNIKIISSTFNMSIVPNPAKSFTEFRIESLKDCMVTLTITDLTGKVVEEMKKQLYQGNNNIGFANSRLLHGVYLVKMSDNEHIVIKKMILE